MFLPLSLYPLLYVFIFVFLLVIASIVFILIFYIAFLINSKLENEGEKESEKERHQRIAKYQRELSNKQREKVDLRSKNTKIISIVIRVISTIICVLLCAILMTLLRGAGAIITVVCIGPLYILINVLITKKRFFFSKKEKIIIRCEQLIDEYDAELFKSNAFIPSCKSDVIFFVEKAIKSKEKPDFEKKYTDENIHTILLNVTYSLLQSGQYNLYDSLNPLGAGISAKNVNDKCLEWLVSKGTLTEEQAKKYKNDLAERIKEVG